VAGASAIGWALLSRPAAQPDPEPISYTEFTRALDSGDVASLAIMPGREIRGVLRVPAETGATAFMVTWPTGDVAAIADRAATNGVDVAFKMAPVTGRV
jgi:hypothetical protein